MNTVLTTAALLTAFAASASAQVPPPAPAAALPPTPAVYPPAVPRKETLRLKFPVGQTLYYKLLEDTSGSYWEPHHRITPIKSHLEMQEHQTVAEVRDSDSAGLIDIGVDSMTVTVDDQPSPLPSDTSAVRVNLANIAMMANLARLTVLKNGKLEATQVNPDVNAEEVLTGEDPAHMNVLAGIGALPEAPVQVGDKWKSVNFGSGSVQVVP